MSSYQLPGAAIELPTCYTRESIPINIDHIPTANKARKFTHLQQIADKIRPLITFHVGTLIGYDCVNAMRPLESVTGTKDQPYAIRTPLGWTIVGSSYMPAEDSITHRVIAKETDCTYEKREQQVHFIQKTVCKELSPYDALLCMERDFLQPETDAVISQEDLRFIEMLDLKTYQQIDGYYNLPLPFRAPPQLKNNREMAVTRFRQIQRKITRDPGYGTKYKEFMTSIIERGEAERVPDNLVDKADAWYIPHHGVLNAKKPGKLRVVYDCSANNGLTSLNSNLLSGPDLNNQLIGVLLRFRLHEVAFMCDIERMYHQFRVAEEDRDFIRFIWGEDGDLHDYRMTVHLFGATSSPNCAKYGLRRIALDHGQHSPEAQNFILKNFYVDDGLTSVSTEAEAIKLLHETKEICAQGNLRLHKIVSNKLSVTESVPPEDRLRDSTHIDFHDTASPPEKALGVHWTIELDVFGFRITLQDKPFTKRGVLSTISSIFDPLGFVAPVILEGKLILRSICKAGGWDDVLSDDVRPKWEHWRQQLLALTDVSVSRCIKPEDFGRIVRAELHNFADASTKGYCCASYLRLMNQNDDICCSLVMARVRVAPLKMVTIPRLELQSAVLASTASAMIEKELDTPVEQHFWTDSTIVLSYIQNEARRFHTYVANRVQKIRSLTNVLSWQHVDTTENPADIGTRECHPSALMDSKWLSGPDFLHNKDNPSSSVKVSAELDPTDKEVRKVSTTLTTSVSDERKLLEIFERISDWERLVRFVTTLMTSKLRRQSSHTLSPVELKKLAEQQIIKILQAEHYRKILSHPSVKNQLSSLDPFLDKDGLLRVGGRLSNSTELNYGVKHPVILPRHSHITTMIIKHVHETVHHQGRLITVNALRSSGYWIVGCTSAVSSYIHRCVICKRHRINDSIQKMADLPTHRTEPAPPFLYSGIDCFGPFYATDGRKESKRYGLVVTCLASRAVHLELLDDLSTDSLINGLRNTIAIRGSIREIRCDNGTNIVGAHNELSRELKNIDISRIKTHFLKSNIDFLFNPPHASNFGGVWERMILTARRILNVILARSSRQSTSALRTVLYEVMAIINSRPLAPTGPTDLEPITPNQLLTGKRMLVSAPGEFDTEHIYARKQWKRTQAIVSEFWRRWETEYLSILQTRGKWKKPQRNLAVGDVVIMKESDRPRNHWRLGLITEVHAGTDKLVRRVKVRLADHTVLERPSSAVVLLVAVGSE